VPGRYGLASADGKGTVGEIVSRDGDEVTRELIAFDARLAPGVKVRLRALAHPGDPLTAHGLTFDNVTFESDVGAFGAWYVGGTATTWAIVVHGRAVGRNEGLKTLPAFEALGLPTLLIQYRNDTGVARSESGFYDYGLSEWRDVEAAVRFALDNGADNVVLFGYSMGAAIVLNFLYQSDLDDRVLAAMLDSPVLDFEDVIDFGAERLNLWAPVTWLGKTAFGWRTGMALHELNYLARADELFVPILLIHGDADDVVHIRKSDRLAADRPDLVTYRRLDGVGHVRAWNVDPSGFDQAIADFLKPIL